MATKLEKIAMIQKFSPAVELSGDETTAQLDEIIKKKNGVEPAPEEEGSDKKPKKSAKSKVIFHLQNHPLKTREFSEEVHGENFNELADEFHKSNVAKVSKRIHDDKEDSDSDE